MTVVTTGHAPAGPWCIPAALEAFARKFAQRLRVEARAHQFQGQREIALVLRRVARELEEAVADD